MFEIIGTGSRRAKHFITENQQELVDYLKLNAPPVTPEERLGEHLFVGRCKRENMRDYFEVFLDHEHPTRTRLHLPLACQIRTYAAVALSGLLHGYFSDPRHLVSVFRDQIIFVANDNTQPIMELAYQDPPVDAPRAWCFGPESICQCKLEQQFERSHKAPVEPSKIRYPPSFSHERVNIGGTDAELSEFAERIVSNCESVFIEGFPGSGKTHFCKKFLIPCLAQHLEKKNKCVHGPHPSCGSQPERQNNAFPLWRAGGGRW